VRALIGGVKIAFMSRPGKFLSLDARLYDYVLAHGGNADPLLQELMEETQQKLGRRVGMQIAPEQGTFMTILARAIGARRAIELGTFTGYSAICIARALPQDGNLLCCDVSQEWTAIARRYFEKAGLSDRITLKLAPALDTLRKLPAQETFDFAFIDADKSNYPRYYEEILARLRRNGLILVDNVLWGGDVLDATDRSEDGKGIRALNDFIASDPRVDVVMLTVSDGLTIARKK
jgi:caffeoyl-CoA O-methyltransferase